MIKNLQQFSWKSLLKPECGKIRVTEIFTDQVKLLIKLLKFWNCEEIT